jgi:hypothetical protein
MTNTPDKIAPLHTRQRRTHIVAPLPHETPEGYIQGAFSRIASGLKGLALRLDDFRYPVDEYETNTVSESNNGVEVQPTYEFMTERIESVIVTGPSGITDAVDTAITAGVGAYTATIPLGANLSGFYAETTPGTATSTTVTVTGALGGTLTFEFTQTASGPGSQLYQPFNPPLTPASPSVPIVVTFNGSASTNAGNLSAYYTQPATFTLQLGDRQWSLTMPASGVLVIAPLSLMLSRADRRLVSSASPGNWTLELMGWGDERY